MCFFCAPGAWTLWSCASCGCAYLDPRPNEASIGLAYSTYFTHELSDDPWGELPKSRRLKLRRALTNGYRNWRFGAAQCPATRAGILLALSGSRRENLDRDLYCLPHFQAGGKLLDAGCGNGAFLRKAKRVGWQVMGVEMDLAAVAAATDKGLHVRQGAIDRVCDMAGQFDVVTISHVVEHVHDPKALLSAGFDLLKPGVAVRGDAKFVVVTSPPVWKTLAGP